MQAPATIEVCELTRHAVVNISQTLEELNVTLNPGARRISISNDGTEDIYVRRAPVVEANATTFRMQPNSAVTLNLTINAARQLRFISPSGSAINVSQMGAV